MKIFIDSGNLREIQSLVPLGIIDGVTTNPSLLAKEPGDPRTIVATSAGSSRARSARKSSRPTRAGMIAEGRELAAIDEHVVVKVPFTREGVKACKALASEGLRVNVTLIFSTTQALLAAKVGAAYVSPFVGRLDDIASDGMGLIRQIVEMYEQLRLSDRRSSSPASAIRCTSSRPRAWAPTCARARPPSSKPASSIRSPTSASRSS